MKKEKIPLLIRLTPEGKRGLLYKIAPWAMGPGVLAIMLFFGFGMLFFPIGFMSFIPHCALSSFFRWWRALLGPAFYATYVLVSVLLCVSGMEFIDVLRWKARHEGKQAEPTFPGDSLKAPPEK